MKNNFTNQEIYDIILKRVVHNLVLKVLDHIKPIYKSDVELDPEGWRNINGANVNIGEDGTINAGMGGKYTGQNISEISGGGGSSTPSNVATAATSHGNGYVRGSDISDNFSRQELQSDFGLAEKIIAEQGFDGLPTVVSSEEFDNYVSENGTEIIYRGYDAEDLATLQSYRNQFESENIFFSGKDSSYYGRGIYASNEISTAEFYATMRQSEGRIDRMTLDVNANVLNLSRSSDAALAAFWILEEDAEMIFDGGFRWPKHANRMSNYATARGYDAIRVHQGGDEFYTVVLNRTALIADNRNHL